jgi:D-alanyl-D-alanine carboxypeptidase (penicillin-binding protein 5/6)
MLKVCGLIILAVLQQLNLWGGTQEWFNQKLNLNTPVSAIIQGVDIDQLSVFAPPYKINSRSIKPLVKAKSVIALDPQSGQILYQKDAQVKRPIASITKLMTALVVLEEKSLRDKVIVSNKDTQTNGVKMWLYPGEEITVANLLKGLLIHSAADAANTLARVTAGSEEQFVTKMNQKVKELDLNNTHFVSPSGLEVKREDNYSTSTEVATLARVALQHKFIREAVKIKQTMIYSTNGQISHDLENTNALLDSYLKVKGIKTGYTDNAGECVVALANGKKVNQQVLVVILNSPDRFQEAKIVIDWVLRNYRW